ncbi:MAG: hypothetical protein LWY06_13485 [Firmicutes bacterium]|nr:hypothetical protein [Bacillota bacterium]
MMGMSGMTSGVSSVGAAPAAGVTRQTTQNGASQAPLPGQPATTGEAGLLRQVMQPGLPAQAAPSGQAGTPGQTNLPGQPGQGGQAGQTGQTGTQGQTGKPGMAQGQTPATGTDTGQAFFKVSLPKGFTPAQGQTMWGTVSNRQGGFVTLQFGKFSMMAQTNMPLAEGQRIQVAFRGINGGQAELSLLKTAMFSRMSESDIAHTLSQMNVPPDGKNMTVAKGMLEFGIALNPRNFGEITKALAQLPAAPTMTDMASCSFLRMCNIPLTAGNVMIISRFIAHNPMLGAQLFELQAAYDKDLKKGKSNISNELMQHLEELPGVLGNYMVDPSKQNKQKMQKNIENLARDSGIERTEYRGGSRDNEDEWELLALTRKIQQADPEALGERGTTLRRVVEIVERMEHNLQAQQLINTGKPGGEMAYYYLQVPVRLDNETVTAEVRVKYYDEEDGRVVDPDDTRIEFDVTTDRLGVMHFTLNVSNGVIDLDVGSCRDEITTFVDRFIPALKYNLTKIGYAIGRFRSMTLDQIERPSLVKRESLETIERVNVQA